MLNDPGYKLVRVASGDHSVHSLAYKETFHPVVGPVAEAEALYIRQTRLIERLREVPEFVIWDIGLGAAANPITVLNALRGGVWQTACNAKGSSKSPERTAEGVKPGEAHASQYSPAKNEPPSLRIISFDRTIEPLRFALSNVNSLPFLRGYEQHLNNLIRDQCAQFRIEDYDVDWELHLGDFPSLIASGSATSFAKPHLIMFDAYSPAANPAMWTLPLFTNIFRLLDSQRACLLPTYSRSTILRVTLLLAGFFVGVGHPTGEKDETTVAANRFALIEEPLDRSWLQRVRRSTSAEPLHEPMYRQAKISTDTWEKLHEHPQWSLTDA